MFRSRILCKFFTLLVMSSLLLPALSVRAQSQAFATITPPDLSKFPTISTLLDVFDDQGQFVSHLNLDQVSVLENGQVLKADDLSEFAPPLQLTVAVNSGPTLGVRDAYGLSRYDKIVSVLDDWVGALPSDSKDDLSLAWNGGVVLSHVSSTEWKTGFDSFDPAPRTSTPSLAALSFALDAVQDTPPVPGAKPAILLISGHLDNQAIGSLKNLSDRAQQAGIRVYVWMTDSNAYLTHPGALALQDLANTSGGLYMSFTGAEALPNPETWFSPLRHAYTLTYTSKIRTSGTQSLSVQVNANGLSVTSQPESFNVNVEPPNPALLSPPIQITRQNPDDPFNIDSFQPKEESISMLVEFPDGHPRPLVRTTLYVDGQKVAENTQAPFDKFTWDLSKYVASGQHSLKVEAEDSLGLSRTSVEVPVQVSVLQPPGGITGLLLRNRVAVTILFLLLAGVVVLGLLFWGGRSGLLVVLAERRRQRQFQQDPVTQPVNELAEAHSRQRDGLFAWMPHRAPPPPAYFVKLTLDGQPAAGDPISLAGPELTFGTDPTQAGTILDDPSISSLHARLRRDGQGQFLLADQNSVAGTWVNYERIPKEGRILKHGDVVHFGNLTYRFVLSKPPSTPKPSIALLKDG